MPDIVNPHFAVPFAFGPAGALCNEQGSADEHLQQVSAILRTPRGTRLDLPTFGTDDPTFSENAPDIVKMRRDVEVWAPGIDFTIDVTPDVSEPMAYRVHVNVLKGVDE